MKNTLSHISFIMDGNNRWSKKKNVTKYSSYSKGAEKLINLSKYIFDNTEVQYISAFTLSSNNLKRSKKLIEIILRVLDLNLDRALSKKLDFSLSFKGNLDFLNSKIKKKIELVERNNKPNNKMLIILLNYSGSLDIANSLKKINAKNEKINILNISKNLTLSKIPDPEILIRSGGYQRLSDYILFNLSYTEFFFTKKLWPDITSHDLKNIISKYRNIERNFGI